MSPFLAVLLLAAVALIQCLTGGARLVYALPAYLLIGITAAFTVFSVPKSLPRATTATVASAALLAGYAFWRAFYSPMEAYAWNDLFMIAACIAVYFITTHGLRTDGDRLIVIIGLLLLGAGEVFVAVRQFTQIDEWMPFGFARRGFGGRASGMFVNPNHLAGFLEITSVFGLSIGIWSARTGLIRPIAFYLGLFSFLGLAITGSRGGYVSAGAALVAFGLLNLWLLRTLRPHRFSGTLTKWTLIALVLIGGAAVLMTKSSLIAKRLQSISAEHNTIRFANWKAAIDQWQLSPVTGTGAGTHLIYGRTLRQPQLQYDPQHAHNDYLELLAEYGLIGGALMAAFLLTHIYRGVRATSRYLHEELVEKEFYKHTATRSDGAAITIGALCALFALLIHSLFDFNLHIPGNALTMAFVMGLLASPGPEKPPESTAEPAIDPIPAWNRTVARHMGWLTPLAALYLLWAGSQILPGEYWAERAHIAFRNRNYPASAALSQKALEHDSQRKNPDTYYRFGQAWFAIGQTRTLRTERPPYYEAALQAYKDGLAIPSRDPNFPRDEFLYARAGEALTELGRYREAEEYYEKAIALDPHLGILKATYARHLAIIGKDAEALELFEKAQKLTDQDLRPYLENTPLDRTPRRR